MRSEQGRWSRKLGAATVVAVVMFGLPLFTPGAQATHRDPHTLCNNQDPPEDIWLEFSGLFHVGVDTAIQDQNDQVIVCIWTPQLDEAIWIRHRDPNPSDPSSTGRRVDVRRCRATGGTTNCTPILDWTGADTRAPTFSTSDIHLRNTCAWVNGIPVNPAGNCTSTVLRVRVVGDPSTEPVQSEGEPLQVCAAGQCVPLPNKVTTGLTVQVTVLGTTHPVPLCVAVGTQPSCP